MVLIRDDRHHPRLLHKANLSLEVKADNVRGPPPFLPLKMAKGSHSNVHL